MGIEQARQAAIFQRDGAIGNDQLQKRWRGEPVVIGDPHTAPVALTEKPDSEPAVPVA